MWITPKTKAALKDAVYVDAAEYDRPGKRWKTVIVCGTFELTEPAHDDELGLDFDSIRISSSKQTMKLTKSSSKKKEAMTDDEKKYGVLEWNSSFSSMPVSGQGKIGNYALSQDFIDDIMLTKPGKITTRQHYHLPVIHMYRITPIHRSIL